MTHINGRSTRINYDPWGVIEPLEVVITHDHPVEIDQSVTIIKASDEGIVLEFYQDGEMTGTIGMTYEEWFALATKRAEVK